MRIFLCALSDPVDPGYGAQIARILSDQDTEVMLADSVLYPVSPAEKAEEWNEAVRSGRFDWILDISGGNLSNTVLPFLDFNAYSSSPSYFAGFSDLSSVLNAIAAAQEKSVLLWQVSYQKDWDRARKFLRDQRESGWKPRAAVRFGNLDLSAPVIGGNIRCFLKLAGTSCWPEAKGKIIFLEGMGTGDYELQSLFSQLVQTGLLKEAAGVVFGRFTSLERKLGSFERMDGFFRRLMDENGLAIPWGVCREVGHIEDTVPLWLNAESAFKQEG